MKTLRILDLLFENPRLSLQGEKQTSLSLTRQSLRCSAFRTWLKASSITLLAFVLLISTALYMQAQNVENSLEQSQEQNNIAPNWSDLFKARRLSQNQEMTPRPPTKPSRPQEFETRTETQRLDHLEVEPKLKQTIRGVAQVMAYAKEDDLTFDEQTFNDLFKHGMHESLLDSLMPDQGQGSGFIIDSQGHLVTNYHVVQYTNTILVRLANGELYPAGFVGVDPEVDIAVLKIYGAPEALLQEKLVWGDSESLTIGETLYALGAPYGFNQTLTQGIVSHLDRNLYTSVYDSFIQTDASINPGNSGGPLLNRQGEVVGINTQIFTLDTGSVGVGFAIPSSIAQPIVERIIRDGAINRLKLGLNLFPIPEDVVKLMDLSTYVKKEDQAFFVVAVKEPSLAHSSGFQVGDILLDLNGEPFQSIQDYFNKIGLLSTDLTSNATVLREGIPRTLQLSHTVYAEDLQKNKIQELEANLEVKLRLGPYHLAFMRELDQTHPEALPLNYGFTSALQIESLDLKETNLSKAQAGDWVVEVDTNPIDSLIDLLASFETTQEKSRPILLRLLGRNGFYFDTLRLTEDEWEQIQAIKEKIEDAMNQSNLLDSKQNENS